MIAISQHPHAPRGAAETPLFEPDDPRAGPFTPAEIEEARRHANEPGRWHKLRPNLDWFAIRLQCGRGMTISDIAPLFGIDERQIRRRRCSARWPARMSERDRRSLARLVWLAGEARLGPDDAARRRWLARISEWRRIQPPQRLLWQPEDPQGDPPSWMPATRFENE